VTDRDLSAAAATQMTKALSQALPGTLVSHRFGSDEIAIMTDAGGFEEELAKAAQGVPPGDKAKIDRLLAINRHPVTGKFLDKPKHGPTQPPDGVLAPFTATVGGRFKFKRGQTGGVTTRREE
jgi:hypothetical protein